MSASKSCLGAGEHRGGFSGGARWNQRDRCRRCGKDLALTKAGRIPSHAPANGEVDEMSYASLADEMNDGSPTDLELDDFNPRFVEEAHRFAYVNGLSWPPQVGDFDRYYEWTTNGRRRR